MTTDKELVDKLKNAIQTKMDSVERITRDKRTEIEDAIQNYEVACRLSRGPVPYRSIHWRKIANERRIILQRHYKHVTGKDYVSSCDDK